jgi:AraC-like DNA-binding protein
MKKLIPAHAIVRMSFLLSLAILLTGDYFFLFGGEKILCFGVDFASCCAILLFSPLSYEKRHAPVRWATLLGAALVLLEVIWIILFPEKRDGSVPVKLAVSVTAVFSYLIYRSLQKYSSMRTLFRNSAVWHDLESYARLLFSYLLAWISIVYIIFYDTDIPFPAAAALMLASLALGVLLYMRARTGRTMLVSHSMEKQIQEVISGNLRSSPVMLDEDSPATNRLYKQILEYMERKKPFLDPDFDLSDLSAGIFSNKSYVSRTINFFSGRNFRQFVNYYRVKYAASLFDNDPSLRVMEAAMMSGFHSIVSFNMAFKSNLQLNPGDYLKRLRGGGELPQRE